MTKVVLLNLMSDRKNSTQEFDVGKITLEFNVKTSTFGLIVWNRLEFLMSINELSSLIPGVASNGVYTQMEHSLI